MNKPATPSGLRSTAYSPTLLSPSDLASFLGVPLPTIYRWRTHHQGPPGFRIGRHVRYRLEDVHEWLEFQDAMSPTCLPVVRSAPSLTVDAGRQPSDGRADPTPQ